MKKIFIITLFLLKSILIHAQVTCESYNHCIATLLEDYCNNVLITSDSLLLKFENMGFDNMDIPLSHSNISDKIIFFNLFPNNFSDFNNIYGWNEKLDSPQILYHISYEHISLFYRIYNIIPQDIYYRKIIDIGIGGYWEADAVNYFQHCMRNVFLNNAPEAIVTLKDYTDEDIKRFWHFFYDTLYYDHPLENKFFKKMYEKIEKLKNTRILELMKIQYNYDYNEFLKKSE